MRGRKKIQRCVEKDHSHICFKPCGIKKIDLETLLLSEDEAEAIRLADYEGLYQQECAQKMGISRPTFSRLVTQARKKIADALLHLKAIEIIQQNDTTTSLPMHTATTP
ncbi:MAG: DUF134 domain-containing protein [Epsilonproteobacteria bacterium]|nr:DUF134 domain-containing protein [Campylobacterota bacterium]